ncbi:hypothetical protein ABID82_000932 [Methylobacterium sp. PvP062]|jgi:Domain of unknown function (DUF4381)|uniref:DUF4381 domain-containing protein n=2 Tax=Methylobacterium TaxID=407 RepID=A0ABV2NH74_9HYPH|nr:MULTISPECIES: DUF4381 family protein [Methylobacterium]MCX7330817.1 DUF4381 family protein [Hyphomicrobiales bacterium]GAN52045.1 hypothetical protein ME121_6152 [Methylobacterium sp. ME121]MBP2497416.1 hypothetical protein [Methylobacterium sp. PvP105]MBP2502713.1 hypothetical protein [Methylobacterium sp. PvP109]OXE42075.1 hypothetical protein CCS92_10165 [Methylobacterium radiotolerans]
MNPVVPAEIPLSLDQLRGLHLPGGAAGAVQGEVVAAAALGFLAALLVGLVRYGRGRARDTLRRAALAELARSRGLGPEARLVAQARLLRRLDRSLDRSGGAGTGATGAAWATRLDGLFRTDFFTRGAGRVLADGLYRRQDPDLDALDAALARLIGRLRA